MANRTKIIRTYSIDAHEFEIFKKNCADRCVNISKFISNKIKEYNEIVEQEKLKISDKNKK
jgi:hypothetical protein